MAPLQITVGGSYSNSVLSVAFSPEGQTVASDSDDHTIKLWDARKGKELMTLEGHSHWVLCVIFSPDGQTVASISYDKTMKLWDAQTGKALKTLVGYFDLVASVVSQSSYDPKSRISVSNDWIAFKNEYLIWLPAEYRKFNYSAIQGGVLAIGYPNGRILIVSFNTK
ncbi:NACHT and WD40 domain protein [Penicillium nucicola]|uniref:NACHT and WD40 domain protein n=1 Tax=Penicillium nucicola TaxID=1850975 RepID=UPI0025453EC9|nr:NACHT and WD40 domain protein [Penicillium nucicola]KAJ5742537.1 NACHT and WD40 domain protein [Penicillium nucicola]